MGLLTLCACHSVRVASVASPTCAVTSVVPGITVCILGALAGVPALVLSAGQVVRTVRVYQALVGGTLDIGVTLVVGRAAAHSPVVFGLAERVDATGLIGAGILALTVDASLSVSALKVAPTSSFNGTKQCT